MRIKTITCLECGGDVLTIKQEKEHVQSCKGHSRGPRADMEDN